MKLRLVTLFISLFISQAVLSMFPTERWYPLFSWRLFSVVAEPGQYFDLKLKRNDGSACYFTTCTEFRDDRAQEIWAAVQEVGLARLLNQPDQIQESRLRALIQEGDVIWVKSFLTDHLMGVSSADPIQNLGPIQTP